MTFLSMVIILKGKQPLVKGKLSEGQRRGGARSAEDKGERGANRRSAEGNGRVERIAQSAEGAKTEGGANVGQRGEAKDVALKDIVRGRHRRTSCPSEGCFSSALYSLDRLQADCYTVSANFYLLSPGRADCRLIADVIH